MPPVWYYLDVLICVSVYINFYFLSFSFLFVLFFMVFSMILWSDSNKDEDDDIRHVTVVNFFLST